ncbi:MAG TPA: hypothetical protein VNQ77_01780 [Frankiaceae bacterium]|nr:hypothetical protein [Frankiaceae bacterium]
MLPTVVAALVMVAIALVLDLTETGVSWPWLVRVGPMVAVFAVARYVATRALSRR